MPQPDNESCDNCNYWVERGTGNCGVCRIGECRKNAPGNNGWPTPYETGWCGDYRPVLVERNPVGFVRFLDVTKLVDNIIPFNKET